MKRMISVLLCAVLLLPIVSALPLQASAATTIEHISLTLEYPEAGKVPAGAVCSGRPGPWHRCGRRLADREKKELVKSL